MKKKITVCTGRVCRLFGAMDILKEVETVTGVKAGDENDNYSVEVCGCIGECSSAPNIFINNEMLKMVSAGHIGHILAGRGCACAHETVAHPEKHEPVTAEDVLKANDFLGDL